MLIIVISGSHLGHEGVDDKAGPGSRDVEVVLVADLDDGHAAAGGAEADLARLAGQQPLVQRGGGLAGHLHPPHGVEELVLHAHVRVAVLDLEPLPVLGEGKQGCNRATARLLCWSLIYHLLPSYLTSTIRYLLQMSLSSSFLSYC